MLLNGGEIDGVRLLGRKTVESMRSNHLLFLDRPTTTTARTGSGRGGAVRRHLAHRGPLGSVGQFGWSGAASTYFNIDPEEGTVALSSGPDQPERSMSCRTLRRRTAPTSIRVR